MIDEFSKQVDAFLEATSKQGVRMLLVGGGAVNFYGYRRHSADVDFWIDLEPANLEKLAESLRAIGYEFLDFPKSVKEGLQNISIKISPFSEIELITRFSVNKSFEDAYNNSKKAQVGLHKKHIIRVLSYEDLIVSKIKSNRPKDLLDIQQLQRLKGNQSDSTSPN